MEGGVVRACISHVSVILGRLLRPKRRFDRNMKSNARQRYWSTIISTRSRFDSHHGSYLCLKSPKITRQECVPVFSRKDHSRALSNIHRRRLRLEFKIHRPNKRPRVFFVNRYVPPYFGVRLKIESHFYNVQNVPSNYRKTFMYERSICA